MPEEIPLAGGNATQGVVRVGDTVRRPAGPWTPAVDALLQHLADAGFPGAPRPLGRDAQGRQVLSFVPGACLHVDGDDPLPAEDATLRRAAGLVRDFHTAAAGFVPPPDARWSGLWGSVGDEIVAHQDLAPWNLVAGPEGWAFIDWDGAGPATRLWDVAYAVNGFALAEHPGDGPRRARVFVDGYGADEGERRALVDLLPVRTGAMVRLLREGHESGTEPWAGLWREGHGRAWQAMTDRLVTQRQALLAALLD